QTLGTQVQGNRDSPAASVLQAIQERFYRCCRHAEYLLSSPADASGTGPGGQSLAEWLQELRDQNQRLALEHEFDRLRQRAERRAQTLADSGDGPGASSTSHLRAGLLTERGLPAYWVVQHDGPQVTLRLDSNHGGAWWQAVLLSLLVLTG